MRAAAEAGEAAPAATDHDADTRILRRRAADADRKRRSRAATRERERRQCRKRRVMRAVTIAAALLALIILASGVAAVAGWTEGRATARTELTTAAAHGSNDAAGRFGAAAQPVAFTPPARPGAGGARNTDAGTSRLEAALAALGDVEAQPPCPGCPPRGGRGAPG